VQDLHWLGLFCPVVVRVRIEVSNEPARKIHEWLREYGVRAQEVVNKNLEFRVTGICCE
jgi:hypothetical protein